MGTAYNVSDQHWRYVVEQGGKDSHFSIHHQSKNFVGPGDDMRKITRRYQPGPIRTQPV